MSLWCGEIRASILLWNHISQCEMNPRSALKKCQRKCKENIQMSVFLPRSPRGLISDHTGNGESLPNNGKLLLILCQNIFKIWTVPSFLWRASLRLSRETSRHAAPIHEAPFIFLSDTLSVMVQRGSILIVWTDRSRERSFDFGCWQNRHKACWVALVSVLPILAVHCIDRDRLFSSGRT